VNETISATVPATELRHLSGDELPISLKIAEQLRRFVDAVGRFGSWFAMPMILITVMDLFIRKARWIRIQGDPIQIWLRENISPFFDSTLLQELEWHSHTALFALVLGFGYIWNTHVRVDLVRETLAFRKKAWLELIGLTFFLCPLPASSSITPLCMLTTPGLSIALPIVLGGNVVKFQPLWLGCPIAGSSSWCWCLVSSPRFWPVSQSGYRS